MVVLSAVVVVCAFVICLALAASSSPVYGFNAKAELAPRKDPETGEQGQQATQATQQWAAQPVVSAAGMQ